MTLDGRRRGPIAGEVVAFLRHEPREGLGDACGVDARRQRDYERRVSEHEREADGRLIRELHGVTLASILEYLVDRLGWDALASDIRVNCFAVDPSITSSLKFLRRTPWARAKVEQLYIQVRSDELRRQSEGE